MPSAGRTGGRGGRDDGVPKVSTLHGVALAWPVLLVPVGLLIGWALRRADGTGGPDLLADPPQAGADPVVPADAAGLDLVDAPAPEDDGGPASTGRSGSPLSR